MVKTEREKEKEKEKDSRRLIRTADKFPLRTDATVAYGVGLACLNTPWNGDEVYFHMDLVSLQYLSRRGRNGRNIDQRFFCFGCCAT